MRTSSLGNLPLRRKPCSRDARAKKGISNETQSKIVSHEMPQFGPIAPSPGLNCQSTPMANICSAAESAARYILSSASASRIAKYAASHMSTMIHTSAIAPSSSPRSPSATRTGGRRRRIQSMRSPRISRCAPSGCDALARDCADRLRSADRPRKKTAA